MLTYNWLDIFSFYLCHSRLLFFLFGSLSNHPSICATWERWIVKKAYTDDAVVLCTGLGYLVVIRSDYP